MKSDAISRETDELIWLVAESADPQAEADFVQRYPQHAEALRLRKSMVSRLKGAKPAPPIATHFVPTRPKQTHKYWLVPLGAGLLVGLAMASYQVVRFINSEPEAPRAREVVNLPPSPVPTQPRRPEVQPAPNDSYNLGTAPHPEEPAAEDAMVVIRVDGARLYACIEAIKSKGVNVKIMPGLEDAPLLLKPNGDDGTLSLSPMAMLKAVQAAADFELLDAGPDGLLALPKDKTTVLDDKGGRPVESRGDGN